MSASNAAPDTTRGSRLGRPLLLFLADELVLLGLHLLHELLEGGGRDDLVELGPVVGDEAHALDDDVVDEPLLAAPEHPVVDRDLGALLGDELGADDRTLALDGFADVLDLLTAVELDLPDVGALEEIREEADELVALGLAPWRPVPRQRALGGFGKVEDVVGDLANRPATILLASILLEFRVFEDFDRPVDLSAKLIGWRAGPGAIRAGQRDQQQGEERERTGETSHRSNPSAYTLPKIYFDSNSSESTGASASRIFPLGPMSLSDPPGLIRMYFSPIRPFVLIEAIESSWSLMFFCTRSVTRAW